MPASSPSPSNVIVAASLFGARSVPDTAASKAPGAVLTRCDALLARRSAERWSAQFNRHYGAPATARCA